MAYYRLYHVKDGRFIAAEEILAADDTEALAISDDYVTDLPAELWCGPRLVKKYRGGRPG